MHVCQREGYARFLTKDAGLQRSAVGVRRIADCRDKSAFGRRRSRASRSLTRESDEGNEKMKLGKLEGNIVVSKLRLLLGFR